MTARRTRARDLVLPVGAVVVFVALATGATAGSAAVAGVLLASTAQGRYNLLELSGWILGGAALFGAVGYGLTMVVSTGVEPTIGLGAGIAVGGGFGAVVRLLEFGEEEPVQPEELTVDRGSEEDPTPQPLDLFEASPAPLLYFDATGEGPVVRAANPAVREVFGVDPEALSQAGLGDALMVTDRADELVEAATAGEHFDAELPVETADGERPLRVRVISVADDETARGYVQYLEP